MEFPSTLGLTKNSLNHVKGWLTTLPWEQLTFLYELIQQTAPLAAKNVGSSEAAVSTAHTQVGNASFHQVEGSR